MALGPAPQVWYQSLPPSALTNAPSSDCAATGMAGKTASQNARTKARSDMMHLFSEGVSNIYVRAA